MDKIVIREMRVEDAAEVAGIYNYYVVNTVASFEVEPVETTEMARRLGEVVGKFPAIVAEIDGRIAGYCYAHLWKSRAAYSPTWEITIYLHPDHLGRGLGKKLVNELIARCQPTGCHALIADITEGNTASERLFESLGFERVSHFKEVGTKFGRLLSVVDYQLTFR